MTSTHDTQWSDHEQPKDRVIATLNIHNWDMLTPNQRGDVVAWLRQQARFLAKKDCNISTRYKARYIVEGDGK